MRKLFEYLASFPRARERRSSVGLGVNSRQGKMLNLQIPVNDIPLDRVQDPFGSTFYLGVLLIDLGRLFLVIEKT